MVSRNTGHRPQLGQCVAAVIVATMFCKYGYGAMRWIITIYCAILYFCYEYMLQNWVFLFICLFMHHFLLNTNTCQLVDRSTGIAESSLASVEGSMIGWLVHSDLR